MNDLNLTPFRKTVAGMQFLFVAFGSTVLVPLLVGLDPATALFSAGAQYPDIPVKMLAIAARGTDGEMQYEPVGPCGSCRQVIIESETRAGGPIRILLYGRKCVYVIDGIRKLMPLTFSEF